MPKYLSWIEGNATCCGAIPLSCVVRSQLRREAWARSTLLGVALSPMDLLNPPSGSEMINIWDCNVPRLLDLSKTIYPQTVLTLPFGDDFCPGLLVPHRDDARGRGQAVPKIKKIAGQCQLFPFSMIDYHSWEKIMTKLVAFSNKLGVCKYHSYNRGQKPSKRFSLCWRCVSFPLPPNCIDYWLTNMSTWIFWGNE